MHLSMLSPGRGGGSRANHGNIIVRSVPRVGILIVSEKVSRTFDLLQLPPGGYFDHLFCPGDMECGSFFFFFFFRENVKIPNPRLTPTPPPPPTSGLTLIGA